jgi:hypothetical protein
MVGKVVGEEKGVGRTQIMNIFKENVRFTTFPTIDHNDL